MTQLASVRRTIEVAVDPAVAFDVFTSEIGEWWRPSRHTLVDHTRAVGMRIDPGVDGRWVEVWDAETGSGYERGRILAWEPGRRLLIQFSDPRLPPEPLTEIEVRFESSGTGTRVTLEHRGWERLPREVVDRYASPRLWSGLVAWYAEFVAART
jgi:uncharacterized protein YndB with AHSA1/START domain